MPEVPSIPPAMERAIMQTHKAVLTSTPIFMQRMRSAIKVPVGMHGLTIDDVSQIERGFEGALYELSAYVLGRRREPIMHTMTMTIEVTHFDSWWQHTKAVHFPTISRWIRRPPRSTTTEHFRTETQEVEVWETFPEAEVGPLPEGFGPVTFQAWSTGVVEVESGSIPKR